MKMVVAPKIKYTLIESYNLLGKTVIPFCTSASSGVGTSATNLQAVDSSQSLWLAGRRYSGNTPKSDIEPYQSSETHTAIKVIVFVSKKCESLLSAVFVNADSAKNI